MADCSDVLYALLVYVAEVTVSILALWAVNASDRRIGHAPFDREMECGSPLGAWSVMTSTIRPFENTARTWTLPQ